MRRVFLLLLGWVTLAACSSSKEPDGKASAAASAGQGAHAHPSGAAARPHADHDPRHGGVVTMEGDNHVEIFVGKDGAIDLYLTDAVRTPIPARDASGTITLESADSKEKQTLTLVEDPAKGSLSAKGPAPDKTEYTWDLKVRGAPMKMTLRVPSGGTEAIGKSPSHHAPGDHAHGSPHGGQVQPLGEGHVEVKLERTGDVTLWMLDAAEKPIPAKGVVASLRPVLAGAKETPLAYDEKDDTLRGKVDPLTHDHVDVVLSITPAGGKAASLRFKFKLGEHGGHQGR